MQLLALTLALAAEPPQHGADERVVVDTLRADEGSAPLVIGPCGPKVCPLQVEGQGDARARVWPIDRADLPYQLVDVDHGWMVQTHNAPAGLSVAWEPYPGLVPQGAALVNVRVGPEHFVDHWTLVGLGDRPEVLWESGSAPSISVRADVRPWTSGGVTHVLHTVRLRHEFAENGHEDVRIEALRYVDGQTKLVAVPEADLPLHAVILAAFPTPAEALAARDGERCLRGITWLLSSGDFPRLTPGLSLLGRVTADRAQADRWLETAKACRADAYLKRAR